MKNNLHSGNLSFCITHLHKSLFCSHWIIFVNTSLSLERYQQHTSQNLHLLYLLLLMKQFNSHQLVQNFVRLWTDPNPLQKSYQYHYPYHNSLLKLTYPKIPLLSLSIHFSESVTRSEFELGGLTFKSNELFSP